jgi:lipoprotein-anchoring transpeptidase ErfK/SrfK
MPKQLRSGPQCIDSPNFGENHLQIDISAQTLTVFDGRGSIDAIFPVSTAANGAGEIMDSGCTPRGSHIIRAKIGAGQPENTVFIGRRPTGEIYKPGMRAAHPHRDWILTRILWLSGCQPGFNRLGNVDSMRRYIYIHGTPDEVELGIPGSAGCIRMGNQDLLRLYDSVSAGTRLDIRE